MSEISNCPKCDIDNTYFDGVINICPDCGYEWNTDDEPESAHIAKDRHGAIIAYGDAANVITDHTG